MEQSARWGRRSFLKGAGVLSLGLAGCLSQDNEQDPDGTPRNGTVTGTAGDGTTQTSTPAGTEAPESTETPNDEDLSWARNRGTLIDTFGDFEEKWTVESGTVKRTQETAFSGKEAVRMDTEGSDSARISRRFETSKDFRNRDVSLAVKPESSTNGFVSVAVQFRGLFGGSRTVSGYVYTGAENRWIRLDFGVHKDAGVNMRAIKEIRIFCWDGEDASTQFYIDDLRIMEKPEKGVVMFNFEGGSEKDYTVARSVLGERGWTGTLFAPSNGIDQNEAPTVAQYREMQKNGWIVGGYTVGRQKLTEYSLGDQEIIFAENRRQLEAKGLTGDFVPFLPPYSVYNAGTLDLVLEYFDAMYVNAGGATGVAVPVTDPRTIGVVNAESLDRAKQAVDDAATFKQAAALSIRMDQVDGNHLKKLCNYVQQAVNAGGVEVLNTAEHFQRFANRPNN